MYSLRFGVLGSNCSMVGSLGWLVPRSTTKCIEPSTISSSPASDPGMASQCQYSMSSEFRTYIGEPGTRCLVMKELFGTNGVTIVSIPFVGIVDFMYPSRCAGGTIQNLKADPLGVRTCREAFLRNRMPQTFLSPLSSSLNQNLDLMYPCSRKQSRSSRGCKG